MKWENKIRSEIDLPHRTLPKRHYEQLTLADDTFRLQIYEEEYEPGIFYPYFVRISGPLRFTEMNDCKGTDKEEVKRKALIFLENKFCQALREIHENLTAEK